MTRAIRSSVVFRQTLLAFVASSTLVSLAGCGAEPGADYESYGEVSLGEEPEEALAAVEGLADSAAMKGYVTQRFGSGMTNRCVDDVQRSFKQLDQSARTARYASQEGQHLPPSGARLDPFDNWREHVQGLTRIALADGSHFVAVSRSSDQSGGGGFTLVNLDPEVASTSAYTPMGYTKRPSGLQSAGNLIAIAADGLGAAPSRVELYQRRPDEVAYDYLAALNLDGHAEPTAPGKTLSGAALGRLQDGRYLILVAGKEGPETEQQGWFYVSDEVRPSSDMSWSFRAQVPLGGRYQNVSLLNECKTRDIYVLATGNADYFGAVDAGAERADLFKVEMDPSSRKVSMTRVQSRVFDTPESGACTFAAAANAFVDESGQLALYCHAHHAAKPGELQLGVYQQGTVRYNPTGLDISTLEGEARQQACSIDCNQRVLGQLDEDSSTRSIEDDVQSCLDECLQ